MRAAVSCISAPADGSTIDGYLPSACGALGLRRSDRRCRSQEGHMAEMSETFREKGGEIYLPAE